ncbi:hypothetical protein CLV51_1138 [Chitinophaga niastensis]|uniref:Uncharacterized protein n=1 Tax=Chitinophaga niastensis TaxID=536980 RepID=A0A2P8H853_CHINA|nr:hypothetical protein [Chitinophaga niastensis]PSL42370.1 hypothetical protein CLV51_1138 [Chitinophaga niastensis]
MKRLASSYPEDAYEMVRNDKLDVGEFLALILFDDLYYKKICEKLATYHKYKYKCTHPVVADFCIPRAEYDGKNGLVKLEYTAIFTFDKDEEDGYEEEIQEEESKEVEFYTNISFTIDTNLKQVVFWFPLFS